LWKLFLTPFMGVPVAREAATALTGGHSLDPGLAHEMLKNATEMVTLLSKRDPFREKNTGTAIQAAGDLAGMFTHVPTQRLGRAGRFIYNYLQDRENPSGITMFDSDSKLRRSVLGGVWHGTVKIPPERR
jgi:hypothetical protein